MKNVDRFEIKQEHILLLNNAYVGWDDSEYGAPAIKSKRPYGNSYVERDIAEILNWEIDKKEGLTWEQVHLAAKLHEETKTALQICLHLLKFETGIYECEKNNKNWVKIS